MLAHNFAPVAAYLSGGWRDEEYALRKNSIKFAASLAAIVAASLASTERVAAAETLLTTNGYEIDPDPANGMSCEQISTKLASIDDTGYRIGGPEPTNDADQAVFQYELSLSVEFFWRCATRVDGAANNDAFRSGFSDQPKN